MGKEGARSQNTEEKKHKVKRDAPVGVRAIPLTNIHDLTGLNRFKADQGSGDVGQQIFQAIGFGAGNDLDACSPVAGTAMAMSNG